MISDKAKLELNSVLCTFRFLALYCQNSQGYLDESYAQFKARFQFHVLLVLPGYKLMLFLFGCFFFKTLEKHLN